MVMMMGIKNRIPTFLLHPAGHHRLLFAIVLLLRVGQLGDCRDISRFSLLVHLLLMLLATCYDSY